MGILDLSGRSKVLARIECLIRGNPGNLTPVRGGVSGLLFNYGPGYRVSYLQRGTALIILLAGEDKNSHVKVIDETLPLAANLSEES